LNRQNTEATDDNVHMANLNGEAETYMSISQKQFDMLNNLTNFMMSNNFDRPGETVDETAIRVIRELREAKKNAESTDSDNKGKINY
jgi:hypothetical protein